MTTGFYICVCKKCYKPWAAHNADLHGSRLAAHDGTAVSQVLPSIRHIPQQEIINYSKDLCFGSGSLMKWLP